MTTRDVSKKPRQRRLAMLAALLTFGAAHFYAGRRAAGAILLALELACLGLATVAPLFLCAIPGIALADAIGAALAIGAERRGTRARFGDVPGPALAALAVGMVPMMLGLSPRTLAGPERVHACELADACGSEETLETCIDLGAHAAFAGTGSRQRDHECVVCLEEAGCVRAFRECAVCDGRIALIPTTDTSQGPMGTRPDDMQRVVPSLFDDAPRVHDELSDHELDDMLRALDDLPPPTTTLPSPAHP